MHIAVELSTARSYPEPMYKTSRGIESVKQASLSLQGMSLVPAVTELLLAELMYLQYDSPTKPIFMYINSAGVQVLLLFFLPLLH